ncbi:Uncharacterized protein APZ42_009540, partial [Daphnia magna]
MSSAGLVLRLLTDLQWDPALPENSFKTKKNKKTPIFHMPHCHPMPHPMPQILNRKDRVSFGIESPQQIQQQAHIQVVAQNLYN